MSELETKQTNLQELKDEFLFTRFKAGSDEAFNVLVERYKARIFAFILKSAKNKAEAEDLFQEVFFKVIEKRDQFRESVSFKAWLYTVARNTCIDAARRHKRKPKVQSIFMDEEKPLDLKIEGEGESPQDAAMDSQVEVFLDEALDALPPEQRETFCLKVRLEMTFEEISEAMDCSVNTAKSRMRYALEKLREMFIKRGYLK